MVAKAGWTAAGLTVVAAAAIAFGMPLLGCTLACAAVAGAMADSWTERVDRLPLAVTLVLAWTIVASHAAAVADIDLYGSRRAAATVLLLPAVAGSLAALVGARSRRGQTGRTAYGIKGPWAGAVTALPALVWAVVGVIGSQLNNGAGMPWFRRGIDNIQHALQVHYRGLSGGLDYTTFENPGGAHAFVATVLAAGEPYSPAATPDQARAGLVALLGASALSLWLMYAVIVLAVTILTRRATRALCPDLNRGWVAMVGAAGGFALFVVPFPRALDYGFVSMVLAAVGFTAAMVAVTAPRPSAGDAAVALVTAVASGMLAVHSWPLMAAVSVPAGLVALWRVLRRWRSVGWGWLAGIVLWTLAMALSAGHVGWIIVHAVSPVARTASGGTVPPVYVIPLVWLLLATPVVLAQFRSPRAFLLAATLLATVAEAVWLANAGAVPITSYYPSKMLWVAGLVAVPLSFAGVAWFLLRAPRLGSERTRLRLVATGAAASVALGTVSATHLAWEQSRAWQRSYAAVTSRQAPGATIAWDIPSVGGGTFTNRMLDFYRLDLNVLRTFPQPPSKKHDCEVLNRAAQPTVLTEHSQAEVTAEFSCAPGVVARTVPAPPR